MTGNASMVESSPACRNVLSWRGDVVVVSFFQLLMNIIKYHQGENHAKEYNSD